MNTYVALLRGINVSGQKQIKMTDLKKLFEDAGFTNIQTYIQSGNVIFESKNSNTKAIINHIEKKIKEKYRFDVEVFILTNPELKNILNKNPFIKKIKDIERLYVTFLSEKPTTANISKLKESNYLPEEFIIDGNVIYLYFPNGYGKAKLNNNFFENMLNLSATTRNRKTVNMLFSLSKKAAK